MKPKHVLGFLFYESIINGGTMLIQNYFTSDVVKDHKLCSIMVQYLVSVNQRKAVRYLVDDTKIDLEPYQVLFEYANLKQELNMEREEFQNKLRKLCDLKNGIPDFKSSYATLQLRIDSQITSLHFTPEKLEGYNLPISKWLEIDIETFLNGKSYSYRKNTQLIINSFIEIIGDKPISTITDRDYELFVQKQKEKNVSVTSVNDYTRALKASLRRAYRKGYFETNPFRQIRQLPEPTKKVVIWEKEEITFLLEKISNLFWLKNVVLITLFTGLRRGEIMNLRWENVNIDERFLEVKNSEEFSTKFLKERPIPLHDEVIKIFKEILVHDKEEGIESPYVISTVKDFKIRDERPSKMITKIVRDENMKSGLNFHGFRKTCASFLRSKGVPTIVISQILGHTNEKVTNLYLGVPSDDTYRAIDQLSMGDFIL